MLPLISDNPLRTNKCKGRILHLLENHLAVAHHQPDLNLLAKTQS